MHPNAFPADVVSILVVAAIIALVIFNVWWKYGRGGTGPKAGPSNRG